MFAALLDTNVLWPSLQRDFLLPDPDDEHVVAAAVVGGAGVIVTDNRKHFPASRLPASVDVLSGREFAADTADVDPSAAARALLEISARSVRQPRTAYDLLDLLVVRYDMRDVDEILRPVLDEILGEER